MPLLRYPLTLKSVAPIGYIVLYFPPVRIYLYKEVPMQHCNCSRTIRIFPNMKSDDNVG